MCGRFVAATPPDQVAAYFGASAEALLSPSWNVAPTNDVYAVLEDGGLRHLDAFRWGLVPAWAKDLKVGARMINARAETLAEKGAFKAAFRRRRCLVPADGFYEWKRLPGEKRKQPHFIRRADGEPLALAGLWEVWRGPDRDQPALRSTTIVTTTPNAVMAGIHDRMPVILPERAWGEWLDRDNDDLEALGRLLVPAPASLLALHPVSTEVNNARNDGPQLIEPAEPEGPADPDVPPAPPAPG